MRKAAVILVILAATEATANLEYPTNRWPSYEEQALDHGIAQTKDVYYAATNRSLSLNVQPNIDPIFPAWARMMLAYTNWPVYYDWQWTNLAVGKAIRKVTIPLHINTNYLTNGTLEGYFAAHDTTNYPWWTVGAMMSNYYLPLNFLDWTPRDNLSGLGQFTNDPARDHAHGWIPPAAVLAGAGTHYPPGSTNWYTTDWGKNGIYLIDSACFVNATPASNWTWLVAFTNGSVSTNTRVAATNYGKGHQYGTGAVACAAFVSDRDDVAAGGNPFGVGDDWWIDGTCPFYSWNEYLTNDSYTFSDVLEPGEAPHFWLKFTEHISVDDEINFESKVYLSTWPEQLYSYTAEVARSVFTSQSWAGVKSKIVVSNLAAQIPHEIQFYSFSVGNDTNIMFPVRLDDESAKTSDGTVLMTAFLTPTAGLENAVFTGECDFAADQQEAPGCWCYAITNPIQDYSTNVLNITNYDSGCNIEYARYQRDIQNIIAQNFETAAANGTYKPYTTNLWYKGVFGDLDWITREDPGDQHWTLVVYNSGFFVIEYETTNGLTGDWWDNSWPDPSDAPSDGYANFYGGSLYGAYYEESNYTHDLVFDPAYIATNLTSTTNGMDRCGPFTTTNDCLACNTQTYCLAYSVTSSINCELFTTNIPYGSLTNDYYEEGLVTGNYIFVEREITTGTCNFSENICSTQITWYSRILQWLDSPATNWIYSKTQYSHTAVATNVDIHALPPLRRWYFDESTVNR